MSKRQAAMIEGFWQSQARGTFIRNYPLVVRSPDRASRRADGLILPDEPHRRGHWKKSFDLGRRRVIVIQSKMGRMGMSVMGRALFSARLLLGAGAGSVRSILLCQRVDAALLPLLKLFPEIEIWLSDPTDPENCVRVEYPGNGHEQTYQRTELPNPWL